MLQCWFQELDKQETKSVSTLLNCLWKCGEKISIAGENGLPAMTKCGLVGKISITIMHTGKILVKYMWAMLQHWKT